MGSEMCIRDSSSFPLVLLLATVLRLSLNVASTRVVLIRGHEGPDAAGNVIASFGEFVIAGNYVVGFIIFIILMIINFIVVTKGAGRTSEVIARFTLDALPGKQMAIDADLSTGLIDEDEARAALTSMLRRRWAMTALRENARLLLSRLQFVGRGADDAAQDPAASARRAACADLSTRGSR